MDAAPVAETKYSRKSDYLTPFEWPVGRRRQLRAILVRCHRRLTLKPIMSRHRHSTATARPGELDMNNLTFNGSQPNDDSSSAGRPAERKI
jgi:hypothetical protein